MRHGSPKPILDMLAAVPLFAPCTKDELERVANLGAQVAVRDGTALTTQGRQGREFFLLIEGNARCLVDGEQVDTLSSGDFFGELALLEHHARNATVVADGDVKVLAFNASEFHDLLESAPSIKAKILAAAAERDRG